MKSSEFLEALKKRQAQEGLTDGQLAVKLGTVPSVISRYFSGKRKYVCGFVAKVFHVWPEDMDLWNALFADLKSGYFDD